MDILSDLSVLRPELWMSIAGMLILLLELVFRRKEYLAFLAVLFIGMVFYGMITAPQGYAFNKMYVSDTFSIFFKIIFLLSAILVILLSLRYLRMEGIHHGEYYSLIMFATTGMMLMASSSDLILLYLGLELMSVSTFILAGFKRHDMRSNESALKYYLLASFSTAILLYGISFLYLVSGTTNITELTSRLSYVPFRENPYLYISLVFILTAFAFKIALVPFHMWSPDVYEGAPTPVTAFMSVGPKAAGFSIIARVFMVALGSLSLEWKTILIILSILTMAVGNILAITQTNIKRMLAYSSIAHSGYAILGIIAGTYEGLSSTMNYILIYAFMNLGAFGIVTLMNTRLSKGEELSDYEGLAKKHPYYALLMLIFMFSLTGIPPTGGFIGKFYLFMSVINAGYTYLAVIAVIMSAVSAYFYLRVVMLMYMKEPEKEITIEPGTLERIAVLISAIMVIITGIMPSYFVDLSMILVNSL